MYGILSFNKFIMKKKFLLFILASLFAITQGAWAAETPQAIWCESNTTLYFINSETVYAEGDTYDGQTVTNVYSGEDVTASPTDYDESPAFTQELWEYCTRVVFDKSFASIRPTSCHDWFCDFYYLTTIEGLENLNTSEVTNMTGMFAFCRQLTSLDLSNFNTAKVTEMIGMFTNCNALETIYVSDGWTVENVTESRLMFDDCYSLVGGQGTAYAWEWDDSIPIDKTYAHIDGGESNPGYCHYQRIQRQTLQSDIGSLYRAWFLQYIEPAV